MVLVRYRSGRRVQQRQVPSPRAVDSARRACAAEIPFTRTGNSPANNGVLSAAVGVSHFILARVPLGKQNVRDLVEVPLGGAHLASLA